MNTDNFKYDGLPDSLIGGMQRWIEDGIPTGDFLTAVLEDSLSRAFGRADDLNRAAMFSIVSWIYNEAPGCCWGSKEKVKAWYMRRGFNKQNLPPREGLK